MAKPKNTQRGGASRGRPGQRGRQAKRGIPAAAIWAVVGVAVVAVAALVLIGPRLSGGSAVPADVQTLDTAKGDPNAPVTLVEFGDFQ